jgi:uncharacterized protein YciI
MLFVALSRSLVPAAELEPTLSAHLDFMFGLEARGVLFASGPFTDTPGAGMSIVRAASADDARAILAADPWIVAGLRAFELHPWEIKEGTVRA